MASIKHKIAMWCKRKKIESTYFFRMAVKINDYVFHRNEKINDKCLGENNQDKVFYVIRGNGKEVGLCSHFITVTNEAYNAYMKGYIPVVDFRYNRTQYNMPFLVNNTWDAWEYYFKPVSAYSMSEVEKSRNVIFSSGYRLNEKNFLIDPNDFSDISIDKVKNWIKEIVIVNDTIVEEAKQRKKQLFENDEVLGVFCRGTDYVALKPKGHPIQPSVSQIIEKTKEYIRKYPNIKKIFLATEDFKIYNTFKEVFEDKLCVSDLELVKDYDGKDYLCNYLPQNKYKTGLDYLIKMLLLSECDYLITSKASGSYFAMVMKDGKWLDKYIYELGTYN